MGKAGWIGLISTILAAAALPAESAPPGVCSPVGGWFTRTSAPTPVTRAWGAFFPPNGRFYLMGGRTADGSGTDLAHPLEYDPTANTWQMKSGTFADSQVNNMVGGVLAVGATKYIFVVGGSAAGTTTASVAVQRYDPVADSLTTISSDPWPGNTDGITLPGGAAVFNNKLYVFGGFRTNSSMVTGIYEFDPNAVAFSRWKKKASVLPDGRGYLPVAAFGAHIYLLGGSTYNGFIDDSTSAFRYDPVADQIAPIASLPRAVGETRAIAQRDGSLWVLGGGRSAPNPSSEVDAYSPGNDTWTQAAPLDRARRNFAADVDSATGNAWAVGGYDTDGGTPLAVTEQYCGDTVFASGFDAW